MAANVTIDLNLETKKAISSVKKFSSSATKSLSSISNSLTGIGALAGAAVAAMAGGKFLGVMKDAAEAASIQEDAIKKMNTALALSGEFSAAASQDMQAFASSIQAMSTVGDEAALEQIALAKSMGATNEQAKKIVQTAVDLSASMGISLESATRNVTKTLGGLTGELGEILPELKNFTAEQLKSGAAIDLVSNKFAGAAGSITQTFGGAITQSQNLLGDLQEEVGFLITKNELVTKGIGLFSKAVEKVIGIISKNRAEIIKFINKGLRGMLSFIPKVVKAFRWLSDAIQGVALVSSAARLALSKFLLTALEFDIITTTINGVVDVFKGLGIAVLAVVGGITEAIKSIPGASSALKFVGLDVESLTEKIEKAGASLVNSLGEDNTDDIKKSVSKMRDSALQDFIDVKEGFEGVNSAIDMTVEVTQELVDEIMNVGDAQTDSSSKAIEALNAQAQKTKDLAAAQKDAAGGFVGPQLDAIGKEEIKARQDIIKIEEDALTTRNKALTAAVVGGMTQGGREGAKSLVVGAGAAVANFIAPGMGEIVGPILGMLSQGPDAVKAMVTGFIENIPVIIQAIAESMPAIIEALVEVFTSPQFWIAMKDALFRSAVALTQGVTQAIVAALPRIGGALLRAFQRGFDDVGRMLNNAFSNVGQYLLDGFNDFFSGINAIIQKISDIARSFTSEGIKEKASGAGDSLKKVFGLAEGGTVPKGYNDDSFPASLTSGELVVPRDDVSRLQRFLSSQENQQATGGNEAILMQILGALQSPQSVSTSIDIDGDKLGTAILNLNRRNVRTA